jgi:TonB family protein
MRHSIAKNGGPFGSRTPRNWHRLVVGLAILTLHGGVAHAQNASEYQVKAAYLYNFVKLAEWRGQSLPNGSPLVIGVVGGDDEFIDTLRKTVAGKTVGTHPITVRRADSVADMDICQVVFFRSSAGHKRTDVAVSGLATASILLVGEDDGFLRRGGMINMVLKNGMIRFEVERASLDRADIRLSPELLTLANSGNSSFNGPTGESRRLKVSSPPEYPELAQKMNIKGTVQVEASVRRDGTVKEVKVIGGHPLLANALAKAVMGWQYVPAAKDSVVVVRFVFGQ